MTARSARRVHEPIILLGAPRSGTTLLAELLAAHPDVVTAGEPRLVWRFGNDRRSDQLRPAHATPPVVEHVHRSFAGLLPGGHGVRLVEKTPANSLRPHFVDAVFPDARYVHITRNGWGAVPSMRSFWLQRGSGLDAKQVHKLRRRLREAHPAQIRFYAAELLKRAIRSPTGRHALYGPRLAGLQAIVDELGELEAAAQQWRSCVEQSSTFGRALAPERYLEVKLETLDARVIADIVGFCGLSPSPEVLERFSGRYSSSAARRQVRLSDEEQVLIAPYAVPANEWLGYPVAACGRPGMVGR